MYHQVITVTFFLLQLALLVSWSMLPDQSTDASVPVAILGVVISFLMCILSQLEHSRSAQPSNLLGIYLVFSVLLDGVQLRTLFILGSDTVVFMLFLASWALKFILLVLESQNKTFCLKVKYQSLPPESRSGIINRSLLWWLNSLLKIGYQGIITENDLFDLDSDLTAEKL